MREFTATSPTTFNVAPIIDLYIGTLSFAEACEDEGSDEWEHYWIELGGEG